MAETDHILSCPYCRVNFYLSVPDSFKFYLPARDPDHDGLFFAPYWRFKGMLSSCVPYQIKNNLVDASLRATAFDVLPFSLGLRPQVLALKYISSQVRGRFLQVDLSREAALAGMEKRFDRLDELDDETELFHRNFFGETVSLIYAPFLLEQGKVFDGITGAMVSPIPEGWRDKKLPFARKLNWDVGFIPTICPNCGWDLKGDRNSLVQVCGQCQSAWEASGSGLSPLDYGLLASEAPADEYLPFWRLRAETEGLPLASLADLIRAANLAKPIRPEWEKKDFHFWAPAFRVHPQLLLRLARNVTVAQPEREAGDKPPSGVRLTGVTLSREDAAGGLKTYLANMSQSKRKILPLLPQIQMRLAQSRLVYFPFRRRGRELVNEDMHLTVNANLLGAP